MAWMQSHGNFSHPEVGCLGHKVPSVLLDNGSALNVCPLATTVALGFAPSDFGPSTQTVRAYDSTKREVIGTLVIDLQIGPTAFFTLFQVLRIPTSFNLLLGRPWIHRAGVIPSSLHQKVKFIHDGQKGPSEFIAAIDHDTTFGLGFIPTKADYRYMVRLRKEMVRARLSHTSFDYPIRPYRMSLVNYFVKGLEIRPRIKEIHSVVHTDREIEIQHLFHQLQLSDGAPDTSVSMVITSTSPDRASMLSLCFLEEIIDDGVVVDPIEMIDGVVPHDEYRDEMDMMTPRELKIGSPLSTDERDRLIHLLRSYFDVFAWSYEMPGLDPSIVQHHSPILPHARPVKKKLRRLHPRWSLQVKEEIQKQLSVGFISMVKYLEWLANVVPVPKKDGKVRVCVDFRDLNKASPKDDFPLPHINLLVDSTTGHSMLSFMDGFSGYNQILMALEDMEKITFITEWGTYCYKVMPFWLKNAGAIYQRAATTFFHDMMHRDIEVYVDDMIVKSQGRADHLEALDRFFERIRKFRLRLNPKKCTFGVTYGKVLGHMANERGIEKNEKEIRGFLGRLQYISRFNLIDRHIHGLGCMLAPIDDSGKERVIYYMSKRMLEYEMKYAMIERLCLTLVWATRRLRHYMIEYSVHLISRLDPLRYLFDRPALTGRLMRWLILLTEFDIHLSGWCMYFDGAANQSGNGIGVLLVSSQNDHIPRFDDLRYVHLPRAQNRFVDTLATLASFVGIPIDVVIRPLLIELRSAPAYCCLIGEIEVQDDLPWYHDIYQFLRSGTYLEVVTAKDQRTLRHLATRFVICGDTLYWRSGDGMLLLCLDRVMREVHARVCGLHMGEHMLAHKIMRMGYFWLTMKIDCCQFVQKCPECQIHGDLIHAPPSELHALTSPWLFSVWGIDINWKVSPKSSNGHEFILVAIDYFTKWVEAASYVRLTSARVPSFIKSHIICRYRIPHELISDRGWAQARFDQLNLSNEKRLRAIDHIQAYQRKMACAFRKRVKPKPLQKGDLVLRILRGLIGDPRGKFRPSWSGPYVIRELTSEGVAWLTDLDGNQFSEPTNVDQLKKYYV
uniref:RNA-directed DNA polymerase n=1 Tax=Vitis vinifera TaxID=29760 RepID=A5C656_VITVI|nr:hypothetical protein VITISV_041303 [Vitis vinifera]